MPADQRVVIVEDHALFAEAVELALTAEGHRVNRVAVPMPGASSTPGAVVSAVNRHRPQVVLLDLDLGSFGDGTRLVEPLTRAGAHVVVVTGATERARWGEALAAGARTVLAKSEPLRAILATVRRLAAGLPVIDPAERDELLAEAGRRRAAHAGLHARLASLTTRESEVLDHLMRGRAVREIAGISVVSEATVRTQVKSILAKLEVSSQLAAVGLAHEFGWRAQR